MTKRKRADPGWRKRRQNQLDWYDGVIATLRLLMLEYGGVPDSMLPRIPWEVPRLDAFTPSASAPWLTRPPACSLRALQLDWVEAKVASTHEA